jgi:outer membrane protein assembly factor BamB
MRWRRFIVGAETPAHGTVCECTHHLLTLDSGAIYYNTNLGAVAAVRADDGQTLWVSLYPRSRRGTLVKPAPHWRRELNPCLLRNGTLFVAPADSPCVFAFDAATGIMLWQSGAELDDATGLLGATDRWLIAGGRRLFWISLRDEDRGQVKHVWPTGAERPGYGRGILAGENVYWPTRESLYVFDQETAEPLKKIDLAARWAIGGNVLVVDGKLLLATERELISLGTQGGVDTPENSEKKPLH